MRGVSAESQAGLLDQIEQAITADTDLIRLGDDLCGVVAALDSAPQLRRALTDPAATAEQKADVVRQLFGGKVDARSLDIAVDAVSHRWSQPRDLGDALERAGVEALAGDAERRGQLDDTEDELFRFGRLVDRDPDLRDALTNRLAPTSAKRTLVSTLLEGKVTDATLHLAAQAAAGRYRSFSAALTEFGKVAAARRQRLVATARVAKPLDESTRQRLADGLSHYYGREIHLNVIVDPDVLGGVRVDIGDEVIDGTVAIRLQDARRRIAG
ncbi:MAG TPA: F0F1 ATP synthase subunit delta [Nocardioidaceae bacterium]|nr:F0F1 ATP synthase subunit delta [Nocardioidaceae bacterium]